MAKKKMNKKTLNKIYFGLGIILILVTLFLLGLIIYMNFIPTKYFLALLGVLFVLVGSTSFILMYKKIKMKLKTSFSIFALILIIVFGLGIYYILSTLGFVSNLDSNYKIENYSVIVLKDSEYNNIKSLEGKAIGYSKDIANSEIAMDELEKTVGITPISATDRNDLINKFLSKEKLQLIDKSVEAIVLEDTYFEILKEEMKDLEEKVKVIHNFSIKLEVEDFSKDVDVTKESFNVYISGIDTYGDISTVARSDVNIVATINPNTNQILLTSIPRDYYVQLHGTTGLKDKLTHAGMYGIDMSVKTIEDLLDIDINYYVRVNFNTLIDLVDTLGGVTVYSDYTFNSKNMGGYSFVKGYNTVDGKAALAFSRERYSFTEGDRQRGKNQQAVITAIIKKMASPVIVTKYTDILDTLSNSFQTNMNQSSIMSLVKLQMDQLPSWKVQSISLNGTDSYNYMYSYSHSKNYVMEPLEETVINAKNLIKKVMNGGMVEGKEIEETGKINVVKKTTAKPATTAKTTLTSTTKSTTKSTTTSVKPTTTSKTTTSTNQQVTSTNKETASVTTEEKELMTTAVTNSSVAVPDDDNDVNTTINTQTTTVTTTIDSLDQTNE